MSEVLAKSNGITLEEHTKDLIACYDNWLEQIRKISPLLYEKISGWYQCVRDMLFFHDQGKTCVQFQENLEKHSHNVVWHELISLAFISETKEDSWGEFARYIFHAIANHHHRKNRSDDNIRNLHKKYIKELHDACEKSNPSDWLWLKDYGWDGYIENGVIT